MARQPLRASVLEAAVQSLVGIPIGFGVTFGIERLHLAPAWSAATITAAMFALNTARIRDQAAFRATAGHAMKAILILVAAVLGPPQCHGTHELRGPHDKKAMAIARGVRDPWNFELDHYLPLALGGTDDESNLWFQPWPQARLKDEDEWRLGEAVCSGRMTQTDAIMELTTKWPRQ